MSLESAVQANTEALNRLTGLLSSANMGKFADSPPALPAEAEKSPPPDVEKPTATPGAIDYSLVKDLILKLSVKKGRNVAMAVLAEFKVTTGLDLKPDQYQPVIDKINAALESN